MVPGARTTWCPAPGFRPLLWPRLLSPSRVGAEDAVGNVPCTVHRVDWMMPHATRLGWHYAANGLNLPQMNLLWVAARAPLLVGRPIRYVR